MGSTARNDVTSSLRTLLAFGLLLCFVPTPTTAQDLYIVGARVLDGVNDAPIEGVTVVIRDGLITSIDRGKVDIPPGGAEAPGRGR